MDRHAARLLPAFSGLVLALAATTAEAATELRYTCYNDGNECEVMQDLLKPFEQQNPGIHVTIDIVPYKAILESLPVQLAAGEGPDMARVTDLGGLHQYYLDLAQYVDRAYWEANFGDTLEWFRSGAKDDQGIYGMMTQLTVTGGFANKTLFDQAGIPLPDAKASWDDWADATRKVAKATETKFPMAMDRSGHRIAGPAISYGAEFFAADGTPRIVDDGFTAYAKRFVEWNQDGTMDKQVWGGLGGGTYQDASQEFINAELVFYYSGSWQIQKFAKSIDNAFDWVAVGSPCGPVTCTGMPGGAGLVGFKSTRHPAEVAKVIDYFASEPVYSQLAARTQNVPAHKGIAAKGVDYPEATPAAAAALKAFSRDVASISPIAYHYQGYKYNRAMFGATATRLTQAIVGELSLEDALARIDKDVADAIAQAKQ
jgi:alpha-1,4-digalacturonate transport system substrate-binding protein